MAAPYFYLYDGTNTLDITAYCRDMEIGGNKRNFYIVDFAGADGGFVKGYGNYSSKNIKMSKGERRDSGDAHFWNSRRDDFIKFFTKSPFQTTYLYIQDGEDTGTWRTPVVCTEIGGLKFKNFFVPDDTTFTLQAYKGFLEKTTATTGSLSITSASEHSMSFSNGGTIECAPTFNFTPTANEESFAVKIAEDYGFLLEGTFIAGVQISYNMANGELTIGGAVVDLHNYLTKSSHFKIPVGTTTLYIICSGAGAFSYSFYQRKI